MHLRERLDYRLGGVGLVGGAGTDITHPIPVIQSLSK